MDYNEIDYKIYRHAFPHDTAKVLAGLMSVARKIDARLRSEGKEGLFERHHKAKAASSQKLSSPGFIAQELLAFFWLCILMAVTGVAMAGG